MLSALSIVSQAFQQYTQKPNSFNVTASVDIKRVGHTDEKEKWICLKSAQSCREAEGKGLHVE